MIFYGQFNPKVDEFIFNRYFKNRLEPGVFIECGAFDGLTESSCKFFEESLNWNAYNIEASPSIFKRLVENRPSSNNFNLALSNNVGIMSFTDVHHPDFELCTNGSLTHTTEHKQWLDEIKCDYSITDVEVITFRKLIERLKLKNLQLLVLDIEGHEIQALEGFLESEVLPEILCIEHGHLGHEHLKGIIEPLGYTFDTTSFVNSFYILNKVYLKYAKIISSDLITEIKEKDIQITALKKENINLKEMSLDEKELNSLMSEISCLNKKITEIYSSRSWKVTSPLRRLATLFK